MSKGQRGNKEAKKPKQAAPSSQPAMPGAAPLGTIAPEPIRFKK